jgi:hypothetical protein
MLRRPWSSPHRGPFEVFEPLVAHLLASPREIRHIPKLRNRLPLSVIQANRYVFLITPPLEYHQVFSVSRMARKSNF